MAKVFVHVSVIFCNSIKTMQVEKIEIGSFQ